MKLVLITAMFFIGLGCVFGFGTKEKTDNSPVITGGWHGLDIQDIDEELKIFVEGYLTELLLPDNFGTIHRVWTQLVQGRKYIFAYHVNYLTPDDLTTPMLGCLILRKDLNGAITVEENFELFDFIELMLTGKVMDREFPDMWVFWPPSITGGFGGKEL
jgi:hypothetical protein